MNLDKLIESQSVLQRAFGFPIDTSSVEEKTELLKSYVLGALDELHEVLHEFSWKSWASDPFINREEVVSEVADSFLFLVNILATVDSSEQEFLKVLEKKTNKNFKRVSSGYSQRENKCKICKRALDDFYEESSEEICPICKGAR